MADILLATLNAKFIHAAFGLRYLFANLGTLQPRAILVEFDINQRPLDIVEAILRHHPRIVGLGIYVWNARPSRDVIALLKRVSPQTLVVLGGPEVSHETLGQEIVDLADHVITGEADLAFADLCLDLLGNVSPPRKIIAAPAPDLAALALPYPFYSEADIAHRIVYVEASRGCPFSCEFCLSSLDAAVRRFPLPALLHQLQQLLDRGLLRFKFVDRTFNLDTASTGAVLEFFLDRLRPNLFLHFEMVPDLLPPELRDLIARFPAACLQLEVGIQTFNPDVADRIHRRQDVARTTENLRFLRTQTTAHLHADLIVGLPGESLESLAAGFDRLVGLGPQEIQVGILKRLRGTSLARHDAEHRMIYNPDPPYDLLSNGLLDFPTMQRLRRFARFWDLLANSGNFTSTLPLLWLDTPSPFHAFLALSDWLFNAAGRHHALALDRLAELLFLYLSGPAQLPPARCAETLARDYARTRRELPPFARPFLSSAPDRIAPTQPKQPRTRQQRHPAPALFNTHERHA